MENFEAGKDIIPIGSANNVFYILANGSATANVRGHNITIKKGDVVGIFDITMPTHTCQYTAAEDCTLIPYQFDTMEALLSLLDRNNDLRKLFILSFCRNIVYLVRDCQAAYKESIAFYQYIYNTISKYQDICHSIGLSSKNLPFMDSVAKLDSEDTPAFYLEEYYTSMRKVVAESTYTVPANFVYGFLSKSQEDIDLMLALSDKFADIQKTYSDYLLNEDSLDLMDVYCDILFRAQNNGANGTEINNAITSMITTMQQLPLIDQTLLEQRVTAFKNKSVAAKEKEPMSKADAAIHEELNTSVDFILSYSDALASTADDFKAQLEKFKKAPDRSSTDKETDLTRRQLTKMFYVIYNEVLQIALKNGNVPTIIKMFLNFGYMDPVLCGFDNAVELYKISENYHGLKEEGIYTFFEWVQEIYEGRKQPSRNEFEQDYVAYVRNLKRERKIDKETETRMLDDNMGKVMYELQSVFPQVNKVTFGRIFSYCPILMEENILKSFDDLLMTPRKILDTFNKITSIDYSAFYHEILFEDQKANIKEPIQIDIRPDVILMPNAGTKGILWQEIEGMYRTTPGRMMISSLHMENVDKTFIRMTGEFRWEMCKRTMGARWNDFASHSLTSDYCSYAQFFNKNRDLSYDTKEKVKELLKRCKNNFKEMFVRDYMTFMQSESNGSSRLNKVVRGILFQYCPFTQEVCDNLKGNGAFTDYLEKYRIRKAQHLHHLNQVLVKYQNSGKPVPEEIASQKALFEK